MPKRAFVSVANGIFHAGVFSLLFLLPSLGHAEVIEPAADFMYLTNQARLKNNLAPLESNSKLTQAAQAKAADMLAHDYFDHTSPDGRQPWDFIQGAGYRYTYAGENLAIDYPNSLLMFEAWMNSPTHRENIIFPHYQEMGVAAVTRVVDGRTTIVAVQMFGSRADFVRVRPTLQAPTAVAQHTTTLVDAGRLQPEAASDYATATFTNHGEVWVPANQTDRWLAFGVFVSVYVLAAFGMLFFFWQHQYWRRLWRRVVPFLPVTGATIVIVMLR